MSHEGLLIHRARALKKAALENASVSAVAQQRPVGASVARQSVLPDRRRLAPLFGAVAAGSAGYLLLPRLWPRALAASDDGGASSRRLFALCAALAVMAFYLLSRRN